VADSSLRILQVNSGDLGGGAERVALNLFEGYKRRGYQSYFAVGHKHLNDPNIIEIPNRKKRSRWSNYWLNRSTSLRNTRVARIARKVAEPGRSIDQFVGLEDFNFPGSWDLLSLTAEPPSLIHCHNLHSDYFDLRTLPWLSKRVPVVINMHDAWLLSGHCAHSFDCDRWLIGCGQCPDLTIYPALRRDATARNWKRKQKIFADSNLYVTTACSWLMGKVEKSMLAPAIRQQKVVPYGVDLSLFHPGDKQDARARIGLPSDAHTVLFAANRIRNNIWKDYATMRAAIGEVAEKIHDKRVIFLALGEDAPPENLGTGEIRFFPYSANVADVANFYRAADVYLHGARADTFPNAVLEALACGTPVVATSVGGIPEQINEGRTGFLIPPGDSSMMAERICQLLHEETKHRFSTEAAIVGRERFSLDRHVTDYLKWYEEILEDFHPTSKDKS